MRETYIARFLFPKSIEVVATGAMTESTSASARFGDLLLSITRHEDTWHASVEECDDPDSALSDGGKYASADRAKLAAFTIARELFGTIVSHDEIHWRWCNEEIRPKSPSNQDGSEGQAT